MRRSGIDTIVLSNLRQRRSQNRVLVIGISLAVFFLAVCVFGTSCLLASYQKQTQDNTGEADFRFLNTEGLDVAALFPEGMEVSLQEQELLFASMGDPENDRDDFAVARRDAEAIRLLHARLAEGRWPEKAGEIVLESADLWRMRSKAGVGDTITLTIAGWDGEAMLPNTEERAFTITGILENQVTLDDWNRGAPLAPNVASAWVSAEEPLIAGSRAVINTYARLVGWRTRLVMLRWDFAPWEQHFIRAWYIGDGLGPHRSVERLGSGLVDFISMNRAALAVVFAIALALVTVAMAGIGAAVGANADKRRGQVGLLRAIGATQTQIGRILRRETLGIALMTLPLGVGGAWLLLWCFHRLWPKQFAFRVPAALVLVVAGLSALFLVAATARPIKKAANVSPLQAMRDVEMLRRQRETRAKSRRRFVPQGLLAARNCSFHRGRMAGIVLLVVAGTLLVSAASWFGTTALSSLGSHPSYDYRLMMGWWGSEGEWGNWDYGRQLLTLRDKQDIGAVPLVSRVESVQKGKVCVLLEGAPSAYVTGDGWDPEQSFYFADGPAYAHYLTTLDGDWEGRGFVDGEWNTHQYYRLFREQYGIEGDFAPMAIIAVDEETIGKMAEYVYDGRVDLEAINAGREVIVVAPEEYFEYLEIDEDGGRYSVYGYGRTPISSPYAQRNWSRGLPEEKFLHRNDTFLAGDTIALSWFMSWDGMSYDPWRYPEDFTRVDASPTIGAVAEQTPPDKDMGRSFFSVVTTERGLAALGMEATYTSFRITLGAEPDEDLREEITRELEAVAARTEGAYVLDEYEIARNNRSATRMALTAFAVGIVLLFTFTAALINSSVSGRIRSDERQIGTMRAVGASRRVIAASYTRQLVRLLGLGGGIGWGAYLGLVAYVYLFFTDGYRGPWLGALALLPGAFLLLLFGVCSLSVRARLRPIFQKPVVENIRIL